MSLLFSESQAMKEYINWLLKVKFQKRNLGLVKNGVGMGKELQEEEVPADLSWFRHCLGCLAAKAQGMLSAFGALRGILLTSPFLNVTIIYSDNR